MTHLLDTNACVEHLRHGSASQVQRRLQSMAPGNVVLCSIVVAELKYGALRSGQVNRNLTQVRAFCAGFASLPLDEIATDEYAEIRVHLERAGTPIGPNDLMIAAIARANGLVLVTHNTAEFSRVPGLILEDWLIP